MRALVTGGAGFIGGHVVERLLREGHEVRVADDLSTGRRPNVPAEIEFVNIDVAVAPLGDVVRGMDIVLHLAALPSVPRSVREPLASHHAAATATLRLLLAARDAGVGTFVTSSSSSVYGDVAHPPMAESMPLAPRSPYAVAKLAAEGYTRAFALLYGMRTVSLRYFNVFGPRQDPGSAYAAAIPLFITSYINRTAPRIYGDGRQSRDFTYVSNVVDANLLAAGATDLAGQSVNIAAGEPRSVLAVLAALDAIFGYHVDPIFEPPRAGDIRDSHADIRMARTLFDYRPTATFDEGLRTTVAWLRSRTVAVS